MLFIFEFLWNTFLNICGTVNGHLINDSTAVVSGANTRFWAVVGLHRHSCSDIAPMEPIFGPHVLWGMLTERTMMHHDIFMISIWFLGKCIISSVSVTRQWMMRAPGSHASIELKISSEFTVVIPYHNLYFNSWAKMIIPIFGSHNLQISALIMRNFWSLLNYQSGTIILQ